MEMVFVTGDTHGDWKSRLNKYVFPEGVELTKDDYVIICGDFGIWDDSPRENGNLDWLENRKFTTLFVAGNHSNYDILDNLPVEEWHGGKVNFIRPSVIHLMRGQVFEINQTRFFAFGGAYSIDKMYRTEGLTWFPEEIPNRKEYEEGWYNLEKVDFQVDYILTHSGPREVVAAMGYGEMSDDEVKLRQYLQRVADNTDFTAWYFGHFHEDTEVEEMFYCLYDDIVVL